MSLVRLLALSLVAMVAFAGNSVLCRAALKGTELDPASFTSIRLLSGAVVLALLVQLKATEARVSTHWRSAIALTVYAACFSYAYVGLAAGTGAILLFGAVQVTMILKGWLEGERPTPVQAVGFALAFSGLIGLLLPGIQSPPLDLAVLMLFSGIGWGLYSLWGRGSSDPLATTAQNFIRSVPMVLVLSAVMLAQFQWDTAGAIYAMASGALTSAIGYAIWYAVLPHLKATQAASLQLSVPVIATAGGLLFLSEPITLRFLLTAAAILGGIGLVIGGRQRLVRRHD